MPDNAAHDAGIAACARLCRSVLGPDCVLDEDMLCTLTLRRRNDLDAFIILWGACCGTLYYSTLDDRAIHEREFADHAALAELLRVLFCVVVDYDAEL